MFDEVLCDFMITTHRTMIEQRVNMRYCRCCLCLRECQNIRVTFLANDNVAAYEIHKEAAASGLTATRQDAEVRLLPAGGQREFPGGLMLRQQPYRIVTNKTDNEPDQLWVKHISQIYDALSEKDKGKDLLQPESEESEEGDSDWGDYDWEDNGGQGKGKGRGKGMPKGKARPKHRRAQFPEAKGAARPKGKALGSAVPAAPEEAEDSEDEATQRTGGLVGMFTSAFDDMAAGLEAATGLDVHDSDAEQERDSRPAS